MPNGATVRICFLYESDFMFQALEYIFQVLEQIFQALEYELLALQNKKQNWEKICFQLDGRKAKTKKIGKKFGISIFSSYICKL